jgi:ribosomal protein L21E
MRTGNVMIGAIKRISSKFEEGDRVKIKKEYGGGSGKVVDVMGSFVIVKTKNGNESYHSSDLKLVD